MHAQTTRTHARARTYTQTHKYTFTRTTRTHTHTHPPHTHTSINIYNKCHIKTNIEKKLLCALKTDHISLNVVQRSDNIIIFR